MKNKAFLSLGSNLGNRFANITDALGFLKSSELILIKTISSIYETSPVGKRQSNFYNCAVKIETELNPLNLLSLLKLCEQILGRKKTYRWGPRLIDIDILFFNCEIINLPNLTIPHKEVLNRLFVLVPLCEMFPNLKHPLSKLSMKQILKSKKSKFLYQSQKLSPLSV
ncbi:MAG: 2-amino-4-hydroxy-6-hydroxymethyldihydropteridine diphosphokinase [Elusimicrobiota bacterium]|jgi:2-amino-4-hydroxy-6-hydroxymethyldihydropteridine diphosphokinase|nr:2-amino-4-hydroxy-6-hydroxymethyldihydropteridine diphosphokinase [Elusimicrobiota bacterium]